MSPVASLSPSMLYDDDLEEGGHDENGPEDSDEDAPMLISDGLSLQKISGGKVKPGRKLFAMEEISPEDGGRWILMFAAIRYNYVAHGPG